MVLPLSLREKVVLVSQLIAYLQFVGITNKNAAPSTVSEIYVY